MSGTGLIPEICHYGAIATDITLAPSVSYCASYCHVIYIHGLHVLCPVPTAPRFPLLYLYGSPKRCRCTVQPPVISSARTHDPSLQLPLFPIDTHCKCCTTTPMLVCFAILIGRVGLPVWASMFCHVSSRQEILFTTPGRMWRWQDAAD